MSALPPPMPPSSAPGETPTENPEITCPECGCKIGISATPEEPAEEMQEGEDTMPTDEGSGDEYDQRVNDLNATRRSKFKNPKMVAGALRDVGKGVLEQ